MTGFSESLRLKKAEGQIPVIPDVKLISPKEGPLFQGRDPVAAAVQMAALGAPALSVVTRGDSFGGSPKLLAEVAASVPVPVLRKDFITTADELKRTKDLGAAAVLLISAILSKDVLERLYTAALGLGLEPLVEVCDRREMALAEALGARLIGVNNRDILTLEKDDGGVARTRTLAAHAPREALLVSESGIKTPADAAAAIKAGAGAVLVGTAIWKSANAAAFYQALCRGGAEAYERS